MTELERIRAALKDRRLSIVAASTGLSEPTIRVIRDGGGNPTAATIEKLAAYFRGAE
jgi:transcriptional regulator with XRE-family HTH domain